MLVHSVEDQPVDEEFVQLALEAGTYYAPTLLVGRNWRRARASAMLGRAVEPDDPNHCVDAETRRVLSEAGILRSMLPADQQSTARAFRLLEGNDRDIALMQANLLRVHEAGIPVTTATDAGNPLTLHGPSIYAEMEAMEAAGIPAREVLQLSTRTGATFMGLGQAIGTLEAGKLADLIVLTEDPGESTRAFRSITHVMRAGDLEPITTYAAE